ncbi:unnamed protein product, partial [Brassica oleracea]
VAKYRKALNEFTYLQIQPKLTHPIHAHSDQTRISLNPSTIFTLFPLTFPLFPSQSPEFAGDRVLTKFWELTHFSFVGTAAAYGECPNFRVSLVNERKSVAESSASLELIFEGDLRCGCSTSLWY